LMSALAISRQLMWKSPERRFPSVLSLCEHGLHQLRCEEWAMQTLLQDLRYATRQLIRNLGLTITAVVSLALGIGATTAVFSVIYATLMNPYPYPAADRFVRL